MRDIRPPPPPFFFRTPPTSTEAGELTASESTRPNYQNRGFIFFFFSHDTVAEVKSQNVTSVVGGCLSLPQNSSRALKLLTIIQLSQVIHHLLQPPSPFLKT